MKSTTETQRHRDPSKRFFSLPALRSLGVGGRLSISLVSLFTLCISVVVVLKSVGWIGVLQKPTELPEVLASELTRRNGLLYHGSQTRPFTGTMFETYLGGRIKSRSMIRAGLLDGLSEGWHTNGQRQVRETFKQGISHGLRTKWHENGIKSVEAYIAEGKHEGVFRRWIDNGVLAEEVTMQGGEPNGIARAYYPSGCLKTEVVMQNGKAVQQRSWSDGEIKTPVESMDLSSHGGAALANAK